MPQSRRELCSEPAFAKPFGQGAMLAAPGSAAADALGCARLVGPLLLLALLLLPLSWWLPLFRTGLWLLTSHEVSTLVAVQSLWGVDRVLCLVVLLFAMVLPALKSLLLLHAWYRLPLCRAARRLTWLARLGKLAMSEVFLVAVAVVAIKGAGIGEITIEPGLYVFAGLVLGSLALALVAEARLHARAAAIGAGPPATPPGRSGSPMAPTRARRRAA